MGILDDAIREHLELKRAHGAADDEIKQKEVEAFGPVRHDAAPAEEPAPVAEQPLDEAVLDAHTELLQPAPEDPYAVHPGDHAVPDPDAPHGAEPVHEDMHAAAEAGAGMLEPHRVDPGPPSPPDHHHDEQHPALLDHDHIGGEEHAPEPVFRREAEAPPLDPSPIEDPPVGDPPVEHPEIDEPPPRQSPEAAAEHEVGPIEGPPEDVLEDTPEFLQDAPEHDRLWFEQRPPRDFDFGE